MILIAYWTQTGNTAKIARAIYEEMLSRGHQAHLKRIDEIAPEEFNAYDLVFLGSACHDSDLAKPVKKILEGIAQLPPFKLAGFATHATYTPEGGKRHQELYERWAGRCPESFERTCQEKEIDLLGYFGCQGAPSPPIEAFIHSVIVTSAFSSILWYTCQHPRHCSPQGTISDSTHRVGKNRSGADMIDRLRRRNNANRDG